MSIKKSILAAVLAVPFALGSAAAPAHAATSGQLGDGDGDGLADIWATTSDHHYVLANTVNGVTQFYQRRTDQPYVKPGWSGNVGIGSAVQQIALPDVTGDGKSDMYVKFASDMYLYRNTGNGAMTKDRLVNTRWGGIDQVFYAGKMDSTNNKYVLARNKDNGNLYAYKVGTNGSLTDAGQVDHGWGGMKFIMSPGDITGDGISDVYGITQAGDMYAYKTVHTATGLGFKDLGKVSTGWTGFADVFVPGDMTGDGKWDVVGVKNPTNPNNENEPIVPAGMTLSQLPIADRSPMYLYPNAGIGKFGTTVRIGHDMFMYQLFS